MAAPVLLIRQTLNCSSPLLFLPSDLARSTNVRDRITSFTKQQSDPRFDASSIAQRNILHVHQAGRTVVLITRPPTQLSHSRNQGEEGGDRMEIRDIHIHDRIKFLWENIKILSNRSSNTECKHENVTLETRSKSNAPSFKERIGEKVSLCRTFHLRDPCGELPHLLRIAADSLLPSLCARDFLLT